MHRLKSAFDPQNIFAPRRIIKIPLRPFSYLTTHIARIKLLFHQVQRADGAQL